MSSSGSGKVGCRVLLIIFGIFCVIALISNFFMWLTGTTADDGTITKSTIERVALPASDVEKTSYYTDADGSWIKHPNKLVSGMNAFYQETGVQPYLYILPKGEMTSTKKIQTYTDQLYHQLFTDQGHFLLVFCDDGQGSFIYGCKAGSQAESVMDDEATAIVTDYLTYCYHEQTYSKEKIFADTFDKAGTRIMKVPRAHLAQLILSFLVLCAALGVYRAIVYRHKQSEQERAKTEALLALPIEKFSDKKIEELAKKYENSSPEDTQAKKHQGEQGETAEKLRENQKQSQTENIERGQTVPPEKTANQENETDETGE